MIDFCIEHKEGPKSRQFQATCLGFITAYDLVEETDSSDNIRPVWATFVASEQGLRPFMANVRLGRVLYRNAHRDDPKERMQFLKSARVQTEWQREPEGAAATMFYPEPFQMDPGFVDPERVAFITLVPEDWAVDQKLDVGKPPWHVMALAAKRSPNTNKWPDWLTVQELERMVPTACLFAAMLDARTRCPMPTDPRFALQILIAALDSGLASLPNRWSSWASTCTGWGFSNNRFMAEGLERAGVRHAVQFLGTHEQVDAFLAEQVAVYLKETA